GYVQTVRTEDGLDQIMQRLWDVRIRLVSEMQAANAPNAGKAKELLATLDGAITEAVGGVASERATGDELAALFKFVEDQTKTALSKDGDNSGTLSLLRELSRRAGFGSIEEEVLIASKERANALHDWPKYQTELRSLIDLYDERGAYQLILNLLEAEQSRDPKSTNFDFAPLIATNARLVGDSERELRALRENYQKPLDGQTQLLIS